MLTKGQAGGYASATGIRQMMRFHFEMSGFNSLLSALIMLLAMRDPQGIHIYYSPLK